MKPLSGEVHIIRLWFRTGEGISLFRLFLQCSDTFFQCGNLGFGIGLFLTFHFDDVGRSLADEFFVAQFPDFITFFNFSYKPALQV
ncbi:hypothetical protein, partial [Phocaeicola barnesiae]|uniref:hypothetical protein n=1 Tax=Phocaeicola barnesiae TaxID=376804 RepID=UPI003C6E0FBB